MINVVMLIPHNMKTVIAYNISVSAGLQQKVSCSARIMLYFYVVKDVKIPINHFSYRGRL